jgi:hypothetical protein
MITKQRTLEVTHGAVEMVRVKLWTRPPFTARHFVPLLWAPFIQKQIQEQLWKLSYRTVIATRIGNGTVVYLELLCSNRCVPVCDIELRYSILLTPSTCPADIAFISTASGLLWAAELIEEHSRIAKTIGQRVIWVSCPYEYLYSNAHSASKGYNGTPPRLIFRRPALTSTALLHLMPCIILAKHYGAMAHHLVDFAGVHLDLHFRVRRSLFMVQLFLPSS